VQLDSVRRNACLPVTKVEERDAGDGRPWAEPDTCARRGDLPLAVRGRRPAARRERRLGDHRPAGTVLEHDVEVAVVFGLHERDGCAHAVDAPLER
jgi:hypothetical protein